MKKKTKHGLGLGTQREPYASKQMMYRYIRSEYRTQLAKMSFDKIFDLTAAGVHFNFCDI